MSGRVHDDRDAEKDDRRTDDVVPIGFELLHQHAPSQGLDHKDAAVPGQHTPEVRIRLEAGEKP